MRAREVARIARLKARKEEKRKERERREQEKFSPPPLRIIKRTNTTRPRASTTVPVVGFADPPPPPPRSPAHKAIHSPPASTARPRKSSFSSPNTKGKKPRRVSWASSTATLDVNGVASEKPIEPKSVPAPELGPQVRSFDARRASESTLLPIPSLDDAIRRMPQARAAARRVSVSIDPRARSGRDMIAVTTPDVATAWSKPADQVERCRRWSTADPLNQARSRSEINR